MRIEKKSEVTPAKLTKSTDIYRPPALRKLTTPIQSELEENNSNKRIATSATKPEPQSTNNDVARNNVQSNKIQSDKTVRRDRRPDREVYIPRARRSQTTPPQLNSTSTISSEIINSTINTSIGQRKINQTQGLINSCNEKCGIPLDPISVISYNNKNVEENQNSFEPNCNSHHIKSTANFLLAKDCDSIIQKDNNYFNSTNLTNQNNRNMNQPNVNREVDERQDKILDSNNIPRIEEDGLPVKESREDKEIKELERVSKEINRSSRRIIKQTFNSDVLEIPYAVILQKDDESILIQKSKEIDPEKDDWDTMFDDNGVCVDPKILSELTASVGKVKIEQPKADYKAYHLKQSILNEEEFPHVLEVSNFPVEFKTQDLMMVFSTYKESGFDIKWVDDTHALAVFSSSRIAAEVLSTSHPFVLLKPLAEATVESRAKARKCASSLQPYRPRPETCAALARRLVTGALGVRLKTATEERENEKRVLREAKERKLLAAKQKDEVWES